MKFKQIFLMGYYLHNGVLHTDPPKCILDISDAQYHDLKPARNYDKCNICFGDSTSF